MKPDIYQTINEFRKEMNEHFDEIKQGYVTLDRFKPVEMVVYGMAGFCLVAILGAVVALVIAKSSPSIASDIRAIVTPAVNAIGFTLPIK